MPDTITAPVAVSAEIEAALADLRQLIGTRDANAAIVYGHGDPWISLSVEWPTRIGEIGHTHSLPTLSEMVIEARAMIRAWHAKRRNDMIRRLALAIIETTDEHTRCTQTLLRAKGFTQPEIDEFGDAACARATEMAGNQPFSVEEA